MNKRLHFQRNSLEKEALKEPGESVGKNLSFKKFRGICSFKTRATHCFWVIFKILIQTNSDTRLRCLEKAAFALPKSPHKRTEVVQELVADILKIKFPSFINKKGRLSNALPMNKND